MKKVITLSGRILFTAFLFSACEKVDLFKHGGGNGNENHTRNFSSEVAEKWIQMQLRIIQSGPALPTLQSTLMGYAGTTLYESVQPGMPGFKSLAGQLNGLNSLPKPVHGKKYHWPSSANAAMASILRSLYANASAALKLSVDSLENALKTQYLADITPEVSQRSADFGKSIATAIFEWSKTDGTYDVNPVYVPPVGSGLWAPTPPGFGSAAQPYMGGRRTFVSGSLDGTDPPAPPPYSELANSPFHNMVKEVYDVSQALTPAQTATAIYYRDVPGFQGGGGHYLALLLQLIQAEDPQLDWAAIAYAKTGISIADALIGCWKVKYQYNLMRPIKYIREVLNHPEWNPVFPTPPHPDYPSGHSTSGGAIAVAWESLLGKNYSFTNHIYDYLGMPPQQYASFNDMAVQIGQSRVYAGIHFSLACVEGNKQGRKIAENIEKKLKFH